MRKLNEELETKIVEPEIKLESIHGEKKTELSPISNNYAISAPVQLAIVFLLSLSSFTAVWLVQSVLYTTIDLTEYLLFHNIAEFFSVMVSLSIFGIGWYAYDQSKNKHALFLSCAFLAIGFIDFMHTLSYSGMPDFITPNNLNKSSQFWIAGRMFSAIAFLVSAFIYFDATYRWISKRILLTAALTITGLVFVGFIYYPSYLPATFVEGAGLTPFKIYSEYVINAILVVALIAYWKRYSRTEEPVYIYFMVALIVSIFSEFAFTLYKSAFDTYNILGHIYKIFAFLLIYYGMFQSSVKYPYMELTNTMGKLREKTEELDRYFTNALDLFCIADTDGYFLRLNKEWETTLGYKLVDLEGKRFLDLVHPDDMKTTLEAISTLESQKEVLNLINRYRCKDGSYRWIEWRSTSSGKIIYAAARDITQRKQAEDAQHESEARYRMLFESMTDCFIQVGMSGEIVDANHAFMELLGYSKEEIRKLRYQDITPTKWHEGQNFIETQVMTRGYSDVYEKEYIRKDGTVFPVELKMFLLRDTDGDPSGMWAIVRDITERKRAEEALRKSEKSLKKAQELGKIGNWEFDMKTQKINWSDEVYVLYERDKKLGPPSFEEEAKYYTPEVAEKIHEFARLATETGKEYRYEFTIRLPKGRIAFFNSTINSVINEKGNVIKLMGTVQDITERKRAEEERIQLLASEHAALTEVQAAKKLDELKSMFIASTSHELRTPLNAIIGFSSMLLEGYSGELNPEQKKQLDIVHSAGKHLLLLISDVIDVSKIEAGKIDLKFSEVELKRVVDEVVSTLGANIKEKGLLVSVEVEKVTLKTDKKRLIQCIYNLIGNAVKYTEKGSIKIIAKTTGNRVDISVTDTGIGIKNEDIPKLFAPFVRLQTPLTEKTSGTGLGLYLVKKLAKDYLGGDVKVESEFGRGSKFTLNIPIELERQG